MKREWQLTAALLLLLCLGVQAQRFETSGWRALVPGPNMPEGVEIQKGNNNLDLVRFGDRFYFAFRTAPTHFASPKARIYIISTADRRSWRHEATIHMGADLREPRFCAFRGRLYFYFFEAGKNPFGFQPEHLYGCEKTADGSWTEPRNLDMDGFVPWRLRVRDDRMYMSAYYGRDLYKTGHHGDLRLYVSTDGYAWQPISPEPQTGATGGEEGEFIFDADGHLWATVRLEGGGAMVAYAHRDSLERWHTYPTRDKYDSALLFRHGNDIFLIARRNLDGTADKAHWLPHAIGRLYNLARYSLTKKVTALWKLNKAEKRMEHLIDFPSTGDTAFPGLAPLKDGKWWLMNYSSDIDGPRKSWIRGQLGLTLIYETELSIVE